MSRRAVFAIHLQLGAGSGALLNCLLTLALAQYMHTGLWVGYLLAAAVFGMVLGGITGAAWFLYRRSLVRASGWVCLSSAPLILCLLWLARGNAWSDSEVRVTLAVPVVWSIVLLLCGFAAVVKRKP